MNHRNENAPQSLIPILKQGPYLIASIQSELSDTDMLAFQEALLQRVATHHSLGIVIDVSLLDVMDSFGARALRSIAQMTTLQGAETIIVGIQPEVAFAMTQLGLNLTHVTTALDLEEGLFLLERRTKERHTHER